MSAKPTRQKIPTTPPTLLLDAIDASQRAADFIAYAERQMGNALSVSVNARWMSVYVRDNGDELQLLLHIDQFATVQQIRETLPLVMKLRQLLSDFQGLSPLYFDTWVLEDLLRQHSPEATYADLAHHIDDTIHSLLLEAASGSPHALKELEEIFRALHNFDTGTNAKPNQSLRQALDTTRLTGEPPAIKIDPEDLRNQLHNYRNSKARRLLTTWAETQPPDPPPDLID